MDGDFSYTLPEIHLYAKDFHSRDMSWPYVRVAREFFEKLQIAKTAMQTRWSNSGDAVILNRVLATRGRYPWQNVQRKQSSWYVGSIAPRGPCVIHC